MSAAARTYLAFQHNAKLHKLRTTVLSVLPFSALSEANRQLFKQGDAGKDHVVITKETIFHPQGGGQPSDEGLMAPSLSSASGGGSSGGGGQDGPSFSVTSVRMDATNNGQVLHLGRFAAAAASSSAALAHDDASTTESAVAGTLPHFGPGDSVEQVLDADKRLLHSRLHTAGHVLGCAVRHLVEKEIEGFDELKASHFPGNAACEFQGAIEGKWKEPIQQRLDEYVKRACPVEVDFWNEDDFRREGLERLIPDRSFLGPGEDKFRVVRIVGLEVYPCGGTHVDTTDLCGDTLVKKITRSKGTSRVSYALK